MCGHLKYGRTVNRSSALKKRAANEWCKESGIVTGVKAEEEGFFFLWWGFEWFSIGGWVWAVGPTPSGSVCTGWRLGRAQIFGFGTDWGGLWGGWVGWKTILSPPPPRKHQVKL